MVQNDTSKPAFSDIHSVCLVNVDILLLKKEKDNFSPSLAVT